MVEPLPRWAKAFFGGLALAVLAGIGLWWFKGTDPQRADWSVDPSAELSASSRTIPILVQERACASGRSPEGRIEVDVTYRADEVHLDVAVRPLRGGQDCQGTAPTPHDVELREPLGDREITGATGSAVDDVIPDGETVDPAPCLDAPGTLRADAAAWYADEAGGTPPDRGEIGSSDRGLRFVEAVEQAVSGAIDGFTTADSFEIESAKELGPGCITTRTVAFGRPDGSEIVVSAWRVAGATAPWWVANEAEFRVRDERTLVSDGRSIRVVLLVAPDGTTARVSGYGPNARAAVSGWPTTTTGIEPKELGDAPATVEQLVDIAEATLGQASER